VFLSHFETILKKLEKWPKSTKKQLYQLVENRSEMIEKHSKGL
jgi:hypothetical protein